MWERWTGYLRASAGGGGRRRGKRGRRGDREGDCFVPARIKTPEASFWPSKYITYIPNAFDEDG